MPEVLARKCPNCGGVLPAVGEAAKIRCEFCGKELDVKHTIAQPRVPPTSVPETVPWPVAPRRSSGGTFVTVAALLVVAIGVAVGLAQSGGGARGLVDSDVEGVLWMKTVGLVAANGDAIEDLVMLIRDQGAQGGDQIQLGVWDGASMRSLWRTPSFGGYAQAYQYTHAAVAGNRVIVTDFRSQAHLFDLASGAVVARTALPDRATRLCPGPGPTQVRLVTQAGQRLVLDTATGSTSPDPEEPAPDFGGDPLVGLAARECPRAPDRAFAPAVTEPLDLSASGLQDGHRLVADDLRVAVGRRASGVRVPMAMGLGPDGTSPTWTLIVPTVDETQVVESSSDSLSYQLAGGRLYVAYELTDESGRLAAIDARTGGRLWETPFRAWSASVSMGTIVAGPNRIVLEQWLQADVFDATTGALLKRIATR